MEGGASGSGLRATSSEATASRGVGEVGSKSGVKRKESAGGGGGLVDVVEVWASPVTRDVEDGMDGKGQGRGSEDDAAPSSAWGGGGGGSVSSVHGLS